MNEDQQAWFEDSIQYQEEHYSHYVDGADAKEVRYIPIVQHVSVAMASAVNDTPATQKEEDYPNAEKAEKTKELRITAQVHETKMALCFESSDEDGDYFFWVPRSLIREPGVANGSITVMAFFSMKKVR